MQKKREFYQRFTRVSKDGMNTIERSMKSDSYDAIKLYRIKVAKDKEQQNLRRLKKMRNSRDSYDGL